MRGSSIISALFYFFLLGFILGSCDREEDVPEPVRKSEKTVLIYLVGKNNLSNELMDDFAEVKKGLELYPSDEEINLLVFITNRGKYLTPTLLRLRKEYISNLVIEEEINTYPGANSTDSEVMKEILLDAFLRHPAQSYGLIMNSHADGWLPGPEEIKTRFFGDDNKKSINIVDLALVLEHVTQKIGSKLDYLLFDACFMQSVEVAYEFRHSINYLIGSPTEVPGPGAPYDIMIPSLFDTNADCHKGIVDDFYNYYEEKYNGTVPENNDPEEWTGGIALSSISMQYIDEYTRLTKQLLSRNLTERQSPNLDDIPNYDLRKEVINSSRKEFYHDLDSLLKSITTEENEDLLNQWEIVHNKMVYYRHTPKIYSAYDSFKLFSVEGTHGISCYVPRKGYENMTDYYRNHEWYVAGGWKDLGW